ncbi:hypothetical protein HMPREF1544_07900 [Mucor circinelloides 1006PhL]|uniref:Uncharacterized protein n=1 Tax=Mucor circinelloides f. circinelloides (strain 1006PhL) TaxID=1220926 RepID=S2JAB5_MUCC1|nr:hypothetical protein HMPREF1544_07900 [Mucor circinelloides 1006PhL]KAG1102856.1 hypothetical protein G6F42_017306 [Rhizopus arrhizus]
MRATLILSIVIVAMLLVFTHQVPAAAIANDMKKVYKKQLTVDAEAVGVAVAADASLGDGVDIDATIQH